MDEKKLAELETAFHEAERNDRVNREDRIGDGPRALLAQFSGGGTAKELTAARRALAEGQAQFERERRLKAEAETASILAANQRIADATERSAAAAEASAHEALRSATQARAAVLVAFATFLLALVGFFGLRAWRG